MVNKIRWCRKITDEHEPFIFEQRAKGSSYRGIAEALGKEYHVKIEHTSIFEWFKNHVDCYEKYLSDLKEVRLANAKARIFDLQRMAEKLGESILDIIKIIPKWEWDAIHLPALVREYRELLAQIQDESGDKVHKFKGEGLAGSNIVFGDQVVNTYADQVIEERRKESVDSGNRFKAIRFSDSGNSLSDN